jgi:DNA-directed RNA polymerase subunit RPC12/RpoP
LREQRFRCLNCKKEFTKIYVFENEHLVLPTKCPHCGSTDLQPLDKASSQKAQAEFAEKVKKMKQNRR